MTNNRNRLLIGAYRPANSEEPVLIPCIDTDKGEAFIGFASRPGEPLYELLKNSGAEIRWLFGQAPMRLP